MRGADALGEVRSLLVRGAILDFRMSRRRKRTRPCRAQAGSEALGSKLSSEELGVLARTLAGVEDPTEATRLRERLTRGFYGR